MTQLEPSNKCSFQPALFGSLFASGRADFSLLEAKVRFIWLIADPAKAACLYHFPSVPQGSVSELRKGRPADAGTRSAELGSSSRSGGGGHSSSVALAGSHVRGRICGVAPDWWSKRAPVQRLLLSHNSWSSG